MSLAQLDAFIARTQQDPALRQRLQNPADPLELHDFLSLARNAGFAVEEADVLAAQQRAEAALSDAELQRRAGEEARRLRHFIPG